MRWMSCLSGEFTPDPSRQKSDGETLKLVHGNLVTGGWVAGWIRATRQEPETCPCLSRSRNLRDMRQKRFAGIVRWGFEDWMRSANVAAVPRELASGRGGQGSLLVVRHGAAGFAVFRRPQGGSMCTSRSTAPPPPTASPLLARWHATQESRSDSKPPERCSPSRGLEARQFQQKCRVFAELHFTAKIGLAVPERPDSAELRRALLRQTTRRRCGSERCHEGRHSGVAAMRSLWTILDFKGLETQCSCGLQGGGRALLESLETPLETTHNPSAAGSSPTRRTRTCHVKGLP